MYSLRYSVDFDVCNAIPQSNQFLKNVGDTIFIYCYTHTLNLISIPALVTPAQIPSIVQCLIRNTNNLT